MNISQKGFIIPLLLILVALLLAGGGVYVLIQKKAPNQPVTESPTVQTTSTVQTANSAVTESPSVQTTLTTGTAATASNKQIIEPNPSYDTIIKVDVARANTIAELNYNGNIYTENVCNDSKMLSLIKELKGISSSVVCKSSTTAWALSAQMKSNPSQYSCSDYTTQGVIRNSAITTTSCE